MDRTIGRWVFACTVGELLGFGIGGSLAALAFLAIPDAVRWDLAIARIAACVGAGAIEGAVLGGFQWRALRPLFPRLTARAWIACTAGAAALCWFFGVLPATFLEASAPPDGVVVEPSLSAVIGFSSLAGVVLGAIFGAFQWLALRSHSARAARWIGANALAWALALPWSYVAGSSAHEGGAASVLAAGAGIAMGLTLAVVTGAFLPSVVRGVPGDETPLARARARA